MRIKNPNKSDGYALIEQAFHFVTKNKDAQQARLLIKQAMRHFRALNDKVGIAHALHFQGRIEHKLGNVDKAMEQYEKALNLALSINCQDVIARSRHERGRIFRMRYMFIAAEEEFRYALDYYATQGDKANLQVTLNQLSALAETALHSPDFFIDALERSGVPIGTPTDYLYVHALAILAEIRDEGRFFRQRLLQKAIAVHEHNQKFAHYILDKAFTTAVFRHDDFIRHLARLVEESWISPPKKTHNPQTRCTGGYHRGSKYNTPNFAAPSIEKLYEYLYKENESGSYVYRGQTYESEKPLLPSLYRHFLNRNDKCIPRDDQLYQHSLRRCGNKFYGEYNNIFRDSIKGVYDKIPIDNKKTIEAVYDQVLRNPLAVRYQFAKLKDEHHPITWDEALQMVLSSKEIAIYERYKDQWEPFLKSYHRRMIRMFGFFKPFGYILGTTLAQQFGLSSQGLDATRDPAIAAFFATHKSDSDFNELEQQGTGIIYRFPYEPTDIRYRSLNDYNYYTSPSIIDLEDVLLRFEHPGLRREDMRDIFECYYSAVHVEKLKDLDLFMIPQGALASSRIIRQQAVIILPDELRIDRTDMKPGVDGITLPEFQYIEDLAARDGVEKFYFRHTGTFPTSIPITREQLWPRDDPFLEIIVSIMTALYPIMTFSGHVIPQRLDLIDGGYDAKQFHELCKSLARRDPMVLVSFQELNALESMTLAI